MPLLGFALAGIAIALIAEGLGRVRVTPRAVSRRSRNVRAWRRAQAYGLLLLPGVIAFNLVMLFVAGGRVAVRDFSSWTPRTFVIGAAVFIAAFAWMRLAMFVLLARHWREAGRIISSRNRER